MLTREQEIDLLYRLVFLRGLTPEPNNFHYSETIELANAIRKVAMESLTIDTELYKLWKETFPKLEGTQ